MSPFKGFHSLVIAAATSVAVMGGVTSAQAAVVATFDFAAAAAGNEGAFDNTAAYATVNGITIQAFASGVPASTPYLDDLFNGNPGGLGVCSSGFNASNGECSVPSDDNVSLFATSEDTSVAEMLTLTFFSDPAANNADAIDVTINPTFFRNALHETDFPSSALIDIRIDAALGGMFVPYTLTHEFTTPLGPGHTFDFRYNNSEFYIQQLTVPLPAALPLFLSALAGLALVGRRQRKKKAAG